jgi:hypothetical protein
MSEIKDTVVEVEAASPVDKEKKFWSLRKKQEPNLSGDPGRSLLDEITKLREAVSALVDINRALCKKIEGNEVKLTALAKFVKDNSGETPNFAVL